jgi:hypothetical protein
MTDTNSILYQVGVAVKEAVSTVQSSIPEYLSGDTIISGTFDGGYGDFLAGFGVGGGSVIVINPSGTLEANVNLQSQILSSTPINPDGEARVEYAIDTGDLYVWDGSAWVKYENDEV